MLSYWCFRESGVVDPNNNSSIDPYHGTHIHSPTPLSTSGLKSGVGWTVWGLELRDDALGFYV